MKKLILLMGISLLCNFLYSQTMPVRDTVPILDTVYLMSGQTVTGVVKDSANDELKILIPKKGDFKADFIDLDLVYSVKYGTGTESIFYKQDTLFGNYYTAQEVKFFLQGERDARNSYRTPWCTAGAFAVGFTGGYLQNFIFTFLPPFAYAGMTTAFRIKIKPGTVSNPDYLKYDTYLLGYEKEAKKHRVFRSLMWGGIGMVSGFLTSSIVQDYNSSHHPQ
jgi:hypothetical protein